MATIVAATPLLHAQQDAAIEQSRLRRDANAPWSSGVDANGTPIPETETTSSGDDSMGAQVILKAQETPQFWRLSGGASFVYTNNAALTSAAERDDVFGVIDAGLGWSKRVAPNVDADFGIRVSLFRYSDLSILDFNSFGFGFGLMWSPPSLHGISFLARYDFAELLNNDFHQILMDHTITLGVQKAFVLGRSHGIAVGALLMGDFADPAAAARSQIGAFVSYRLQVSRHFETTLLLRPAVHFYTDGGRVDFNQIVSCNLHYAFNERVEANGFVSFGLNRSDRSVFDYNAFSTGGGLGFTTRF